MSPLTDITNSPGHEPLLYTQHKISQKRERMRLSRSCPRIPCHQSQDEIHKAQSHKIFKEKFESVAIKMCNIHVSNQKHTSAYSQGFTANCMCSNSRSQKDVLLGSQTTDILLSQAVETLSLSQNSVQSGLQISSQTGQHRKKFEKIPEKRHKVKSKVVASRSGLPETPGTCESGISSQQCGACGQEFTSLPLLTLHLARHVYDGLYAAQWLNQAMSLVVSRQPSSATNSHDDKNSINGVQNSSVD